MLLFEEENEYINKNSTPQPNPRSGVCWKEEKNIGGHLIHEAAVLPDLADLPDSPTKDIYNPKFANIQQFGGKKEEKMKESGRVIVGVWEDGDRQVVNLSCGCGEHVADLSERLSEIIYMEKVNNWCIQGTKKLMSGVGACIQGNIFDSSLLFLSREASQCLGGNYIYIYIYIGTPPTKPQPPKAVVHRRIYTDYTNDTEDESLGLGGLFGDDDDEEEEEESPTRDPEPRPVETEEIDWGGLFD